MASQSVQPLRIHKHKGAGDFSPTQASRPLAALSPMDIRRNSPSFPRNNKNIFKSDSSPCGSSPFASNVGGSPKLCWQDDSSTYDSSPFGSNIGGSPRLFWQAHGPTSPNLGSIENRDSFEQEQPPANIHENDRSTTPEEQWQTPSIPAFEGEFGTALGTPDSVIRHPISRSPSPEIAEPVATIKAPGSKLKTRPSLTPADASTMAATRRHVSGQTAIPEPESSSSPVKIEQETSSEGSTYTESGTRISSLVQLDIPRDQSDESLGFGLEKEFDRVLETQKVAFELSLSRSHHTIPGHVPSPEHASQTNIPGVEDVHSLKQQDARALVDDRRAWRHHYPTDGSHFANRNPTRQRGYLMRQNTKVVIASNRTEEETRPDEIVQNAPVESTSRKISQQTWVTEPWNGKSRRRSIRTAGETSPRKKGPTTPIPPLPGQASAVQDGLGVVAEDGMAEEEEAQEFDEKAERGRLFVKVVGVKDLDLPLQREEGTLFSLTLDNGLHCVTTSWLPLGKTAPIGQEFELVVLNELEFQLTLQMKLEQPKAQAVEPPIKTPPSPLKKQSAFSRLFGSPKKNKEADASRPKSPVKSQPPSMYDMVQNIVAQDGSFARAYVALGEHEKHAFGRPYTVDVTCFNEWATEDVAVGSSRSKKSVTAKQRRLPYQIGKLELQLLYIPKPKAAKDEDMPKSMNSAVREIRDAEARTVQMFEGHLSQQGGDCPYWRRRLFKLAGSKLTAFHETTHQPRATINLAKASRLIDDKSALTKKETSTKGGGRRKSAFAEEEDGYMFVEEGFRIRFGNGEVIDFYADSAAEKSRWMKVLSEVVGKPGSSSQSKPWVEMVLKRGRSIAAREGRTAQLTRPEISPRKSSKEQMQEQMAFRTAARQQTAVAEEEAQKAAAERSFGKRSSIPVLSGNQSPEKNPRYLQGGRPSHARTESSQPSLGSRSQPGSPVKSKMSKEARYQKARSMIGMQWH